MTDKKLYVLIRRAIRNDREALVELCKLKARDILYLCRLNTRTQQDADDAAQEVFLQVQKSIGQLRKPESFNAWLSRLITYTCNSLRRKNVKHENYLPIEEASEQLLSEAIDFLPQQYLEDKVMREQIVDIVKALPDAYRQCVLLHYFQQLSYKEIADILDITQDKVGNNLRMARKHLKIEIDELHQGDKKVYSATPMIALSSALPAIFHESAQATVSAQSIAVCLKAGGVSSTAAVGSMMAGSGGGAAASGVLFQAIVFVAAACIGVGAVGYTINQIVTPLPTTSFSGIDKRPALPQEQSAFAQNADKGDEEEPALATNYSLSGRVFLDSTNEAFSLTENGLSGVVVELVSVESGEVVAATSTQEGMSSGAFSFKNFEDGSYRVRIVLPAGMQPVSEKDYTPDTTTLDKRAVWLRQEGSSVFSFTRDQQKVIDSLSLAVKYEASIKGRVGIESGSLAPGESLPATTISLSDPRGSLLAVARTDSEGSYCFTDPPIGQSGEYTLHFSVADVSGLQIPYTSRGVFLHPGQSVTVPMFGLLDVTSPQIELVLTGGECECGHLNPTGAHFTVFDKTEVSSEWSIRSAAGEEIEGGGDVVSLSTRVALLTQGEYLLTVVAQDTAGNRAQQERELSISGR